MLAASPPWSERWRRWREWLFINQRWSRSLPQGCFWVWTRSLAIPREWWGCQRVSGNISCPKCCTGRRQLVQIMPKFSYLIICLFSLWSNHWVCHADVENVFSCEVVIEFIVFLVVSYLKGCFLHFSKQQFSHFESIQRLLECILPKSPRLPHWHFHRVAANII